MFFFALIVLCLSFATGVQGGDASKKDQQALQGTWRAVEITVFGEKLPKKEVDRARFRFDGDKWFQQTGKAIDKKGTFRVDAEKKMKLIDMRDDERGEKMLGIYSLKGKTLRICAILPSPEAVQKRPGEFSSTKENGCALFLLEKFK